MNENGNVKENETVSLEKMRQPFRIARDNLCIVK